MWPFDSPYQAPQPQGGPQLPWDMLAQMMAQVQAPGHRVSPPGGPGAMPPPSMDRMTNAQAGQFPFPQVDAATAPTSPVEALPMPQTASPLSGISNGQGGGLPFFQGESSGPVATIGSMPSEQSQMESLLSGYTPSANAMAAFQGQNQQAQLASLMDQASWASNAASQMPRRFGNAGPLVGLANAALGSQSDAARNRIAEMGLLGANGIPGSLATQAADVDARREANRMQADTVGRAESLRQQGEVVRGLLGQNRSPSEIQRLMGQLGPLLSPGVQSSPTQSTTPLGPQATDPATPPFEAHQSILDRISGFTGQAGARPTTNIGTFLERLEAANPGFVRQNWPAVQSYLQARWSTPAYQAALARAYRPNLGVSVTERIFGSNEQDLGLSRLRNLLNENTLGPTLLPIYEANRNNPDVVRALGGDPGGWSSPYGPGEASAAQQEALRALLRNLSPNAR